MLRDIRPRSPIAALRRDYSQKERHRTFDAKLVCAVAGMSPAFVRRVLGRISDTVALSDVLILVDQDAFQETFVPRSRIPGYLLSVGTAKTARSSRAWPPERSAVADGHHLVKGSALNLIPRLPNESVQCVVTSTPYWGTRLYEEQFSQQWADGEECPLGHEQTPEGFIRHTIEVLFHLKRVLANDGSIWWNLMDVYNTRTQIRTNASETLNAMQGNDSRRWTEHHCRRYSAGHAFLKDGEQCGIPGEVASRLSRIGLYVKSLISWKKSGSLPETVSSRVTRELEYIIHASKIRTPRFHKERFRTLPASLGGRDGKYEAEKLTDIWHFPTANGTDGHGAQFPVALPARCIALSTEHNHLVLDPFAGSGTTSVAALLTGRHSLGFDVSDYYLRVARGRLAKARLRATSGVSGRPEAPAESQRTRTVAHASQGRQAHPMAARTSG